MAAALELIKLLSRKRNEAEEVTFCEFKRNEDMAKERFLREMEFETEATQAAALSAIVVSRGNRSTRGADELRNGNWWTDGYQNWDEDSFKKKVEGVSRNI